MAAASMVVAGVMSGTSADGVDVALCRISAGRGTYPRVKLLAFAEFPYAANVRRAVLSAMGPEPTTVAEISRLHWRLGALYADAVEATAKQHGVAVDLAGCHGQTIYHQATAAKYLGAPLRATMQIGEASAIAERLHTPVVSDFRPADLAAGGQGAPLVPMLDLCLFRHRSRNRVLLNLGGIANLTAIPAGVAADGILAFDTGPANMVIDGCMEALFRKPLDRDGSAARRGKVLRAVVSERLKDTFFAAAPPKSCGREQFGATFVESLIAQCRNAGGSRYDTIATATALTAQSIQEAYGRFVWAHLGQRAPLAAATDLFVSGGGARNPMLMEMLRTAFAPLGVRVRDSGELDVPTQAKEAMAFALLAWLTWNRLPGNVMAATGASRPVILGRVTHG